MNRGIDRSCKGLATPLLVNTVVHIIFIAKLQHEGGLP